MFNDLKNIKQILIAVFSLIVGSSAAVVVTKWMGSWW
jgi:hypothetical protein